MTQRQPSLDYQLSVEQLVLLRKQSAAAFAATMAILFYLIFKIHNLVVSLAVLAHTHYEHIKDSIELRAENKNLLKDVTDALKKEETESKAKSNFLANMSHELRTPLNTIIGYSEIIHDDVNDKNPESIIDNANKITAAGKHLLSLINDVLDL